MQGAVLCKGHLLCHTIHCAAAAEHNLQDNTAHAQMHARPEHSISYNPLQLTEDGIGPHTFRPGHCLTSACTLQATSPPAHTTGSIRTPLAQTTAAPVHALCCQSPAHAVACSASPFTLQAASSCMWLSHLRSSSCASSSPPAGRVC